MSDQLASQSSGLMDPTQMNSASEQASSSPCAEDVERELWSETATHSLHSKPSTTSVPSEVPPINYGKLSALQARFKADALFVDHFWAKKKEEGYEREWFTTVAQHEIFYQHEAFILDFKRKQFGVLLLLESRRDKMACRMCLDVAIRLGVTAATLEGQLLRHYIAMSQQYWMKLEKISTPGPIRCQPPRLPLKCPDWMTLARAWCKAYHSSPEGKMSVQPLDLTARLNPKRTKMSSTESLFTDAQIDGRENNA